MYQFTDLRDQLATYLSQEHVAKISEAYAVAEEAHKDQTRYTGEPYITHPLEVARILAGMSMDHECIMGALLHDVIEDTDVDKQRITKEFGEKVAELVDGVSKLTQIKFENKEEQQAENFRKMMMAMSKDVRVVLIKLADRLHNMRTLGTLPAEKRRRIASETLEIYAPIAARLGMNHLKLEFEDLGFSALHPYRYRILKDAVRKAHGNRKTMIQAIERAITKKFKEHAFPLVALWGRDKHLYSIYRKMQEKGGSFSDVMDVYGFRLLVATEDDCYRSLGVIHQLYKPVMGRFKDYIAMAKPNGYQSLHTTVRGPHGVPIEIQIRTEKMDEMAERGIASHWLYKNADAEAETAVLRTRAWMRGLLDIEESAETPIEFIQNVKIDLHPDDVYVFTPKGTILALPEGSTPVDFAYAVHTDLGNTCVACKVDRRLSPLSTRLDSGQTIEIITVKGSQPDAGWLSFVVTGKARSNIRNWFKTKQRSESQALGKRLLERAISDLGGRFSSVNKKQCHAVLTSLALETMESLYEEIGLGLRHPQLIAQQFMQERSSTLGDAIAPLPLSISGTEGLVIHFAPCCYPIPGDPIAGVLTPGEGITVHMEGCETLANQGNPASSLINLTWEMDSDAEFRVELIVGVINRRGALATIAGAIAESNANIVNVSVDQRDSRHNNIHFVIMVRDRNHLARVMRRLRTLDRVTHISRHYKSPK